MNGCKALIMWSFSLSETYFTRGSGEAVAPWGCESGHGAGHKPNSRKTHTGAHHSQT